ncbi:shikimate kinase [Lactiplantibacillus herbarum]|uniref:shikimate kinase n=1 Tax=Lactiplantibacillus herbarum TaxID=1670446 RepID=UPI00064F43C0|nr:shikimate kinase [Lactiplantibacillus herbarum]
MQAILIGFMGSGKTTVGRLLAQKLATEHADLDDLIIQRAGQPITSIFAKHGETYFRQLEHQTLEQAMTVPGILSTGGGTPTIAVNAKLLMSSSVPVIWLAANDQTILRRVQHDASRPLVNELDENVLLALKQQRNRQYAAAADLIIPTDRLTPVEIVRQIKTWLSTAQRVLQG